MFQAQDFRDRETSALLTKNGENTILKDIGNKWDCGRAV